MQIQGHSRLYGLIQCATSAVLTFAALPPFEWSAISWICLVPWLSCVHRCATLAGAIGYSFVFGSFYSILELDWMRCAGAGPEDIWGRYGFVWILICAVVGCAYSSSGALMWCLNRGLCIPIGITIPVSIAAAEALVDAILRNCGGTTIDLIRLALTQVNIPFARSIAEFGGAEGLGAFVALMNSLVLRLLIRMSPSNQTGISRGLGLDAAEGISSPCDQAALLQKCTTFVRIRSHLKALLSSRRRLVSETGIKQNRWVWSDFFSVAILLVLGCARELGIPRAEYRVTIAVVSEIRCCSHGPSGLIDADGSFCASVSDTPIAFGVPVRDARPMRSSISDFLFWLLIFGPATLEALFSWMKCDHRGE